MKSIISGITHPIIVTEVLMFLSGCLGYYIKSIGVSTLIKQLQQDVGWIKTQLTPAVTVAPAAPHA